MSKPRHTSKKHKKRQNTPYWIVLIATLIILLLGYLWMANYFTSHFLPGTKINGLPFSGKTAPYVTSYFQKQIQDYTLTIENSDNTTDIISSSSISLSYQSQHEIDDVLKKQPIWRWPLYIHLTQDLTVPLSVDYNKEALQEALNSLSSMTVEQKTQSISAAPEFDGTSFVVKPEVYGTEIDFEQLQSVVTEAITTLTPSVNLLQSSCYVAPKYTAKSEAVIKACESLNKYCTASITYQIGSLTEVIDKSVISSWLSYDADMNVSINRDAVKEYFREFGRRYDTLRSERSFTTPTGKSATVSGGTYGWSVDEAAEIDAAIAHIENGETITKEPAYVQTAASHDAIDWGTTYIEVDLTTQYMWYIKDGTVVFQCDVVTGAPIPEKETPTGVYYIMERLRNKTLIGATDPATGEPSYRQPVEYWARVTGTGIGFHDADWQSSFGGNRYLTHGSHGCINMRPSDAATFYDMISNGTPVIIHK